jgi:glycosyltransferase involved in cell wall biosynthesis
VKVLIAHNRYRTAGGEERHVDLLESGLRERGVAVRRFERDSSELAGSRLKRFGAAVTLAYRPGGGGIGEAVDDWSPDVVHFNNLWPLLTPAALRVARTRGAVVVLTLHNYRFACPGGTCPSRDQPPSNGILPTACIEKSALRCALQHRPRDSLASGCAYGLALEVQRRLHLLERWADALISPTSFVARMLRRAGLHDERVHVIPYGITANGSATAETPGRFALFSGRLTDAKGLRTLMTAARLAPEVAVVVAGEGPLAAEVRGANVTYVGRLDREAMARAMAQAVFVVAPSEWHENFPYSALEAQAAGKAVVATNVGGLPEMIVDGKTGLLVPPGEPNAFAGAMRRLWADRVLAAELGAAGMLRARRRFSLEAHIEATVDLYERLRRNGGHGEGKR